MPKSERNPKPDPARAGRSNREKTPVSSSDCWKASLFLIRSRWAGSFFCAVSLALLCGCATPREAAATAATRRFDFQRDTFAYANELRWEYQYDANGKWTTHWRHPKPAYSQHCFVMARSAQQFFLNARFDPRQPVANEATYRRLIRRVVSTNPRRSLPKSEKTVIPGYADLRAFSGAQAKLLQAQCGGAWQSYFQRGHWRILFPFSRRHQAGMAEQLLAHLKQGRPLIAHLVRFPELTINHALVIFDAQETGPQIQFSAYDPNQPSQPRMLTYDSPTRTFLLPANDYFPGGRLDVYEVDHKWNY
jgi:hypothetical protein